MDNYEYERKYYEQGLTYIAGVDEVGRGPLAGPVVCASVIMPKDKIIEGVTDSKKLSEKKREALAKQIKEQALSYCIYSIEPSEIDKINILNAVKKWNGNILCRLKTLGVGLILGVWDIRIVLISVENRLKGANVPKK